MKEPAPKFEKIACVGDDPIFAAQVSSLLSRPGYYLPVLDGPRMGRPDASNEVVRRNNAIARIKPRLVVLNGLPEEARIELRRCLPSRILLETDNIANIASSIDLPKHHGELSWGPQNLAVGLLLAKKERYLLRINQSESPEDIHVPGDGGHLVILEANNDIADIITANYAYSINASLLLISPVVKEDMEDILESLYTIYSSDSCTPSPQKIEALLTRIRDLAPEVDTTSAKCVTFVTSGLPWGIAYPETPCTHLYRYPDLGISLVNAISSEQKVSPGIRVALLVDPGAAQGSEVDEVADYLANQGAFPKIIRGHHALTHEVSQYVEAYPYDLLLISTHAGEVEGYRRTYRFTDSEEIEREIMVDIAVSIGAISGTELYDVKEFIRYQSLDGIEWNDTEKKKDHYIGTAILDFNKLYEEHSDRLLLVSDETIPRVRGSMALKMFDSYYIPTPHLIADRNLPIIFNNACCSWITMSKNFIFAGARAYIGTIYDVTNAEAISVAKAFFSHHGWRPLPFVLWRAQRQVYGENRRPFVMLGPHFIRMRPSTINPIHYLVYTIRRAITEWHDHAARTPFEDVRENAQKYIEFLQHELYLLLRDLKRISSRSRSE